MDPASVFGVVASALTLAGGISKAIDQLTELATRWRVSDLSIKLFVNQLNTLRVALQQLHHLANHDTAPRLSTLCSDVDVSVSGCHELMELLETKIRMLDTDHNGKLDVKSKLRLLRDHAEITVYSDYLDHQINALHLYISVLKCATAQQSDELVSLRENGDVLRLARETTESLLGIHDSTASVVSSITDNGTAASHRFTFDSELFMSKPYRSAGRQQIQARLLESRSRQNLRPSSSSTAHFNLEDAQSAASAASEDHASEKSASSGDTSIVDAGSHASPLFDGKILVPTATGTDEPVAAGHLTTDRAKQNDAQRILPPVDLLSEEDKFIVLEAQPHDPSPHSSRSKLQLSGRSMLRRLQSFAGLVDPDAAESLSHRPQRVSPNISRVRKIMLFSRPTNFRSLVYLCQFISFDPRKACELMRAVVESAFASSIVDVVEKLRLWLSPKGLRCYEELRRSLGHHWSLSTPKRGETVGTCAGLLQDADFCRAYKAQYLRSFNDDLRFVLEFLSHLDNASTIPGIDLVPPIAAQAICSRFIFQDDEDYGWDVSICTQGWNETRLCAGHVHPLERKNSLEIFVEDSSPIPYLISVNESSPVAVQRAVLGAALQWNRTRTSQLVMNGDRQSRVLFIFDGWIRCEPGRYGVAAPALWDLAEDCLRQATPYSVKFMCSWHHVCDKSLTYVMRERWSPRPAQAPLQSPQPPQPQVDKTPFSVVRVGRAPQIAELEA